MGTVTVYFVGLCTHLRHSTSGVVEHRVVLINASRDRLVNGRLVRKHTARVRIGKETFPLEGVTLQLNAASSAVTYEESYETCIPPMRSHAGAELGPISAPMATWENADLVSAYFDAAGTFSAGANERGAAIAVLTVQTAGAPVLTFDPFTGETTQHPLVDGAKIVIENIDDAPGRRTDHDFLLHYKMLMRVPPEADWPRQAGTCERIDLPEEGPYETVGPGCSNSVYP